MAFLKSPRAKIKVGDAGLSLCKDVCGGEGGLSGVTSDFKHYMV